ncbi:MAG TPA: lysine--tRNA ligase [Acidimicrobiia bacterium]|nr:lysine--tRNA ligase [Acidimicrobiia bacterium]
MSENPAPPDDLPPRYRPELIPYRFERTAWAAELHHRFAELGPGGSTGVVVSVAGRVLLHRSFGKLAFATIRDDTGRIQLLADSSVLDQETMNVFLDLDLGDWVGVGGEVVTTRKGELSVRVATLVLLAKALRPLPDKWHGMVDVEARSRHRYVDLIVNEEAQRVARARSTVLAELRRQFTDRGYVEVETPVLLMEATGALARPFLSHHEALDLDMKLRISLELYLKRLVVGGMERVFEIGRIFRNEGIDSTHNPEFTMLESYEALADYTDIMALVEEVFAAVALAVNGTTRLTFGGREIDLTPPYRRARFMDLVAEAVGEEVPFDRPLDEMQALARRHGIEPQPAWGHGRIAAELYESLVENQIWDPTFVVDQPKEISPLARVHRTDPNLTERFELVIAGSEYANAFSELVDPIDQRERFLAQARARVAGDEEAHPVDEDFLRALEYGMPPTGGLGIGVDRLVMLLTDTHHIRDVILFPTLRPLSSTE